MCLQSKEMFDFLIRFMNLCQKKHSISKPGLLDLPADHASSKGGADLAVLNT